MPKRAPTPPPPDDEPKYFTVCYPYPAGSLAIIHQEASQKNFCYWISKIIGHENLFSLFNKPTNMVIIEVNRSCSRIPKLLGEHRWSEFLCDPSPEEKQNVSKIFYCTLSSGREVEKHGWKRKSVVEGWFIRDRILTPQYKEALAKFKDEYPSPFLCDVPRTHAIAIELCRPIPGISLKVVVTQPKPPVGSAEWAQGKASSASIQSVNITSSSTSASKKKNKKKNKKTNQTTSVQLEINSGSSTSPSSTPINERSRRPSFLVTPHPASTNVVVGSLPPGIYSVDPSTPSDGQSVSNEAMEIVDKLEGFDISDSEQEDEVRVSATFVAQESLRDVQIQRDSYWDAANEDRPASPICEIHGTKCNKGICQVQSQKVKDSLRAKKYVGFDPRDQYNEIDSDADDDFTAVRPRRYK